MASSRFSLSPGLVNLDVDLSFLLTPDVGRVPPPSGQAPPRPPTSFREAVDSNTFFLRSPPRLVKMNLQCPFPDCHHSHSFYHSVSDISQDEWMCKGCRSNLFQPVHVSVTTHPHPETLPVAEVIRGPGAGGSTPPPPSKTRRLTSPPPYNTRLATSSAAPPPLSPSSPPGSGSSVELVVPAAPVIHPPPPPRHLQGLLHVPVGHRVQEPRLPYRLTIGHAVFTVRCGQDCRKAKLTIAIVRGQETRGRRKSIRITKLKPMDEVAGLRGLHVLVLYEESLQTVDLNLSDRYVVSPSFPIQQVPNLSGSQVVYRPSDEMLTWYTNYGRLYSPERVPGEGFRGAFRHYTQSDERESSAIFLRNLERALPCLYAEPMEEWKV